MVLRYFSILLFLTLTKAENMTVGISELQTILLGEFDKKMTMIDDKMEGKMSSTERKLIGKVDEQISTTERKVVNEVNSKFDRKARDIDRKMATIEKRQPSSAQSIDDATVRQLKADIKKLNDVIFDYKTKAPVWTPSNDSVCPYGALPGTKKYKQETFTDGELIPYRHRKEYRAKGWDTFYRTHRKSSCQYKCQKDKDCVRSIWMPKSKIHDCAITRWSAMQKDCSAYENRGANTNSWYGHWTPTCTETDPCIVQSLMCKCPKGLLKSDVAMIDLGVICGAKSQESASMLCAADD